MSALEVHHSAGEQREALLAHPNPIVRALVGWAGWTEAGAIVAGAR